MPEYHRSTAYHRQGMSGHMLDWSIRPDPFKAYKNREPISLPAPNPPRADLFRLCLNWPPVPESEKIPDSGVLAAVLLMSAGVTARSGHGLDSIGLRAPASAGALYPAELYAVASGVQGLEDGAYHFSPKGPGLHRLWRENLAAKAAGALGKSPTRLTFIITACFWRSMWKYRTRAYRYCLLDAGHMLANLELACAACGMKPLSSADFVDSSLNVLLGLASEDEAAVAAAQAGGEPDDAGSPGGLLPPMDLEALPLSEVTGRDPAIRAAHQAGELLEPHGKGRNWLLIKPGEGAVQLAEPRPGKADFLNTVRSRRSRRNFLRAALNEQAVSTLLRAALPTQGPCQASVILGPGGGLEGGSYHYIPGLHLLMPNKAPSDPRWNMAQACLGQMWVGQAALCLLLWADMDHMESVEGPRAYRHAMIAAGRAGQRLYLAAQALGLGCCGVGAFYDEELAQAAALPINAQPLYLLACGPVKGWPQAGQ